MKYSLLIASCYLVSFNSLAQQSFDRKFSDFVQFKTDSTVKKTGLPGMLVAVFDKERVGYFTSGYADLAIKQKFDKNTVFEIGSITKTLTAYVLMKALREKKIGDTTSIYTFLPDSVQQNSSLRTITFLSLLNHTSGLPSLPDNLSFEGENRLQPYANYTSELFYGYLMHAKPLAGNKVSYSNFGAALAGELAVRLSNTNYNDLLHKHLFKPLRIAQKDALNSSKAVGYLNNLPFSFWKWDVMAPAGAITLNAADLLTYLQFMSAKGPKEKPLIDLLTTPTAEINKQVSVARGWHTYSHPDGSTTYWHNGGTYGFSTFAAFSKNQQRAVLVVGNAYNQNAAGDTLGFSIMQKLLDDRKP